MSPVVQKLERGQRDWSRENREESGDKGGEGGRDWITWAL